jgi:hypothetical protein
MLQCIKTFPSKIKDIDFTRGNPNRVIPYGLDRCIEPVQRHYPYDEGRGHHEGY